MRNRLPLLLLSQKDAISKLDAALNEEVHGSFSEKTHFVKSVPWDCENWKEAITSSFKVMDKEIKLQENLDFSCSGTTAVVAIRQVNEPELLKFPFIFLSFCFFKIFRLLIFFLVSVIENSNREKILL